MIYRITFFNEEVDNFKRVFDCNPDATFLDLHKAVLASVKYPDDQMTSFFLCNDRWEKEQEVTLVPMENSFEYDNMVMEDTRLSDLLTESKQRLIYVFDPMFDRNFFGELTLQKGEVEGVQCVVSTGKAPKQLETEDFLNTGSGSMDVDADFYGSDEYDADELDPEGFGDMNFDDSSLF